MEYQIGRPGRIVAARLYEGEELYESIESLAHEEAIQRAAVFITGGLRRSNIVVGPTQEQPRIEPDFQEFIGPGEVLGVGTLYPDDKGPKLHMHVGIGSAERVIVGCPRPETTCFLILEVTIIEMLGITGFRRPDDATGFNLLSLNP
jgi:uncharacterized protein